MESIWEALSTCEEIEDTAGDAEEEAEEVGEAAEAEAETEAESEGKDGGEGEGEGEEGVEGEAVKVVDEAIEPEKNDH